MAIGILYFFKTNFPPNPQKMHPSGKKTMCSPYTNSLKIIRLSTCQTKKTLMTNSEKWWVHFLSMCHLKKWFWWLIHSDIPSTFLKSLPSFDTNFLKCPPWLTGQFPSTFCSSGLSALFLVVGKRGYFNMAVHTGSHSLRLLRASNFHMQGDLWCGQPCCS